MLSVPMHACACAVHVHMRMSIYVSVHSASTANCLNGRPCLTAARPELPPLLRAPWAELDEYRSSVLRAGATYLPAAVPPIVDLPTLDASNTGAFPEWHAYVRHVYGASVAFPINLNNLAWFYWFAPLRISAIYLADWRDGRPAIPFGTPWTGGARVQGGDAWYWGPEHLTRRLGFFVHRPPWSISTYRHASRWEVMRIGPIDQPGNFVENGTCWFFHAYGSGVFVRTDSFDKVEVFYYRFHSTPRIELVGKINRPQLQRGGRVEVHWPVELKLELSDGTACDSSLSMRHHILYCANLPFLHGVCVRV